LETAIAHHEAGGSTQSHQRRPEDHTRATRCACGDMLLPTIDRHPAPRSMCFTRCPSFTRCCPSSTRYNFSSRGTPSPVAVGDLRLSGAVRTSTTSSASFGPCGEPRLVLKHRFLVIHCHHVLFCARAPNCRNDSPVPFILAKAHFSVPCPQKPSQLYYTCGSPAVERDFVSFPSARLCTHACQVCGLRRAPPLPLI